ncbi:hypothetical protein [Reyranella sp.]|uniref:hypothetical protein n=1 Tax=Reyranella sp. TaxID=1929291 RepID=UPI003D1497C7
MPIPEGDIVYNSTVPLEINRSMPGLAVTAGAAANSVALPEPSYSNLGDIMTVYCEDGVDVWFAIGAAGDLATFASVVAPAGPPSIYLLGRDIQGATHMSFLIREGTARVTVNFFRRGQ